MPRFVSELTWRSKKLRYGAGQKVLANKPKQTFWKTHYMKQAQLLINCWSWVILNWVHYIILFMILHFLIFIIKGKQIYRQHKFHIILWVTWNSDEHKVVCCNYSPYHSQGGFPWWLNSKESICNARYTGSIPGLGRSPGEGNGNPLQYSCLGKPWTEQPSRLQSMGLLRVRHNWTNGALTPLSKGDIDIDRDQRDNVKVQSCRQLEPYLWQKLHFKEYNQCPVRK